MIFLVLPWVSEQLNQLWNNFDFAKAANIAVILAAVYTYFKIVRPLLRAATEFFEDWFGERPRAGIVPRPGVPSRVQELEKDVDSLLREDYHKQQKIEQLERDIKAIRSMITPIHTYVKEATTGGIPAQRSTARAESNR